MAINFLKTKETRFSDGTFLHPTTIHEDEKYYYITTAFKFKDDVKLMKGARWMGYDEHNPMKIWRVEKCTRNDFRIAFLEGHNPYERYDSSLEPFLKTLSFMRPLYQHQKMMVAHGLFRKHAHLSCEMGTGKTLASIEILERAGYPEVWFVGTKSSTTSVRLEFYRWDSKIKPTFMTYDELKKIIANWKPGAMPPRAVVFDECSKLKTPSSQRSQAAFHLTEAIRHNYGTDSIILAMSGSPAPKSPVDFYWQCEVVCPGFLREGDVNKFKERLAIIEKVSGIEGVTFPKLVAWRDGKGGICNKCGKLPTHALHTDPEEKGLHKFEPLTDEVGKLYRRMRGLSLVQFKKDCLDLPVKVYRELKVKANLATIRAAQMIQVGSRNTIDALTRLRELSDGFQYVEVEESRTDCTHCVKGKVPVNGTEDFVACMQCEGGKVITKRREIHKIESPKYDALTDLLNEDFEDENRIVIYAAFTASIDRVCEHVFKLGWHPMRVDGRGWVPQSIALKSDSLEFLKQFQDPDKHPEKIAFVGHPGSAGMGLTLTASKAILYFSNDFNFESRVQSEDRIHRPGMSIEKGATIIDLVHLPSDAYVLKNLKRKQDLQKLSLGMLWEEISKEDELQRKLEAALA